MDICRFDDFVAGRALVMRGAHSRITARDRSEFAHAMQKIDAARAKGQWIALIANYEVGYWLEPSLHDRSEPADDKHPHLSALVFDEVHEEPSCEPLAIDTQSEILSIKPRIGKHRYMEQVSEIRRLIAAGEVYQINYTFPLDVHTRGDAGSLYRRLANANPSAHAAYIEDGDRRILSFSPELFLHHGGGKLTTRPMKGTAPRDADPEQDRRFGAQLQASAKDQAENLMIVDLLRNDLGRIARTGSVAVENLFALEQYATVWTLTSTITADIGEPNLERILRALFPCGSVTGAPKIAAMHHIRRLEIAPRGVYCGSIGWLAPDGRFSMNVAIRTLVLDRSGEGVYCVGGGIVMDSDPAREWEECKWKSRIIGSW
ncbi:aminodeoxychorismate synthase component I [Paraburkholderia pallida]|uniref:Aminodeoxychorismate synthase component I n=1 Tax=Paraburkholderia pallida TaxID=2547399 RepID=A0A4P7CWZ5_9BURK|nr:aminodeoxychorismate synthase component I [Paraburkholderia pallida]QBR00739.1 aminodeoxychorismate synthase component I [Paraburkholderia pallida]